MNIIYQGLIDARVSAPFLRFAAALSRKIPPVNTYFILCALANLYSPEKNAVSWGYPGQQPEP